MKHLLDDDGPIYLTRQGKKKIEQRILRNERDVPQAIIEVRRTAEMGDLSENAAYQIAKQNLRRMQAQIIRDNEMLKRVIVIEPTGSDVVQLGSNVCIENNGKQYKYEIVGPYEADPSMGRISNVSPLGSKLIGKRVEDKILIEQSGQEFKIIDIK